MSKISGVSFVVVLLLGSTLFAAGCGGDDSGGGSATADGGTTTANVDSAGSDGSAEDADAGSQSSEPGSNDIEKAEFIRKVEAICYDTGAKALQDIKKLIEPSAGASSEEKLEELIERADEVIDEIYGPRYREEIDRIRALGYPAGDEAQIEAMLTAFEATIQRAEADPDAFVQLNTVEGNPENPFKREDGIARRYGLKVCPRV